MIYCLQYMMHGAVFCSIGYLIPLLAIELDKNSTEFGIMFLSRGIGMLIGYLIIPIILSWLNSIGANINQTLSIVTLIYGILALL